MFLIIIQSYRVAFFHFFENIQLLAIFDHSYFRTNYRLKFYFINLPFNLFCLLITVFILFIICLVSSSSYLSYFVQHFILLSFLYFWLLFLLLFRMMWLVKWLMLVTVLPTSSDRTPSLKVPDNWAHTIFHYADLTR